MPAASLANPNRPLTEKMREFVKYWAQGETVLMASFKAGYSDNGTYAYRLAKDPAILKIYNEEKRLYAESCQMTRKRVMEGLLDGIETAKLVADPGSIIRGWREVGLMCGYYEPMKKQIDINITGDLTMKHLEQLSDTDLLRIIKGEAEDTVFREIGGGDE